MYGNILNQWLDVKSRQIHRNVLNFLYAPTSQYTLSEISDKFLIHSKTVL